jgi:hypothetical protein
MFVITFTVIALVINEASSYTERDVPNSALGMEVRKSLPLYMNDRQFIVSDDGSTVFSKSSELNRFTTVGQRNKVGEKLVFKRIAGQDWCLTMSQSAHAGGASQIGSGDRRMVSALGWSKVFVYYTTSTGGHLAEVNMDQRGPRPNRIRSVPFLRAAVRDLSNPEILWGFRPGERGEYLESADTSSGRRTSSVALPNGFAPLDYDPFTRRIVALKDWPKGRTRARIAIYHPPSRSMRLLPLDSDQGRYWMSQRQVYFQGSGKLMVARGNKWEPISDDIFLGKSANDKYWLLRRKDDVILRTFN